VAVERVVIRPFALDAELEDLHDDGHAQALAFVIDNLNLIVFGPGEKLLPPLAAGTLSIGGLVISYHKVMVCVLAIGILAALELFLSYAQYGQAMRAVAQDMQGASMVGIHVSQIFSYAFGLRWCLPALPEYCSPIY
jgi:branched-chain amino acid transport system permease protein